MTLMISYKRIVLKLVLSFLLGKCGRDAKAWQQPNFDTLPETKVICQGDRVRLQCANASMGLLVYSAMYGRTEPGYVICPYKGAGEDQHYNCGEIDVTNLFKTLCEKRTRCKVKVNSALFGDPCPDKHLYLNLVYACKFQKRKPKVTPLATSSSTVTTEAASTSATTLPWTTSTISSSSIQVSSTVTVTGDSSSTSSLTQTTPVAQEPSTVHTTNTEAKDLGSGADNTADTLQVEQAGSNGKSGGGSLGIAGALFVWFLFMQDHSSDYITVFFCTAAGALSLGVIAGVYVLYCHRDNNQQQEVTVEPKLSAYGTTDSKPSEEVDPFILGPMKVPPPDYMLHEYNWTRGNSLPHKNPQNGSVVKDVGSKDLNGHIRRPLEAPKSRRRSFDAGILRVQRPDGSTVFLKTSDSSRSGRGRYVDIEHYPKTKKKATDEKSGEVLFY